MGKIAIVGGGPGGLMLARILQCHGLGATVFERDRHPLERPQGGSLDIHEGSGQWALREAGLHNRFLELARYDDQGGSIHDQHGSKHFEEPCDPTGTRPEIDRLQLRQLLIDSLGEGVIRWGTTVASIRERGSGRYELIGEAETLGHYDLVVGADGAWSRVRPLLTDVKPAYSGVVIYDLRITSIDTQHVDLATMLPHGKLSAIGQNRGLMAQRSSAGEVRVYLLLPIPEEELSPGPIDLGSARVARADMVRLLEGWSPSLVRFVEVSDEPPVCRPIVSLPAGLDWPHRPGVTLIGDAAHVMAPFGGEGVNLAMQDAAELGFALARGGVGYAIAEVERRMMRRAEPAATMGLRGIRGFVADNALARVLERFQAMATHGRHA